MIKVTEAIRYGTTTAYILQCTSIGVVSSYLPFSCPSSSIYSIDSSGICFFVPCRSGRHHFLDIYSADFSLRSFWRILYIPHMPRYHNVCPFRGPHTLGSHPILVLQLCLVGLRYFYRMLEALTLRRLTKHWSSFSVLCSRQCFFRSCKTLFLKVHSWHKADIYFKTLSTLNWCLVLYLKYIDIVVQESKEIVLLRSIEVIKRNWLYWDGTILEILTTLKF